MKSHFQMSPFKMFPPPLGPPEKSGSWNRGVEFKGGSLHDGFGGSGEHLALLLLGLQNTLQAAMTVLTVLAVSVVMASPLKLNPLFPTSSKRRSNDHDSSGHLFYKGAKRMF